MIYQAELGKAVAVAVAGLRLAGIPEQESDVTF